MHYLKYKVSQHLPVSVAFLYYNFFSTFSLQHNNYTPTSAKRTTEFNPFQFKPLLLGMLL